jgi:hypothetical protein
MADRKLIREKVGQAGAIRREKEIDLWLTFVRETSHVNDPSLSLIVSPSLQMTCLEDDVLVTPTGIKWLCTSQTELWCI